MADYDSQIESIVGSASLNAFQTSLTGVVNKTFTYANSSLFAAAVNGYYRDYCVRYVRPACQWLDGYVPELHNIGTGVMSTRIASALISGLARTICGEKLVFKVLGDNTNEALDTLDFVSKWAKQTKLKTAVKNGVAYALGIGTSFIKANRTMKGDVWLEAVRFDNAFYLASYTGEIQEASFLIRGYVDTEKENKPQYFLAEHRFWKVYNAEIRKLPDGTYETIHRKGDKEPMVEYCVYRATSTSLNNTMSQTSGKGCNWNEIPYKIRKMIKDEYAAIRLNEPQKLGFPNLAVEVLINDLGDISIPTGGNNFGKSLIVQAQDNLVLYELAESYLLRDMYNGKGTVYKPRSMTLGTAGGFMPTKPSEFSTDGQMRSDGSIISQSPTMATPNTPIYVPFDSPYEGMDNKYETIPGVDPQSQQVIVNQFELRPDQWELIKENQLKQIAVKWGMSPKILSSFLAQGQAQMTATQIDSEDDISIAFINQTRADFKEPINRLMETVLNFYGRETNVEVDFASPSIINKDRILDRITKKLEIGLIDVEDAIRELNPDMDEATLQNKIKKAQQQRDSMLMQQYNELNAEGTFGNNYDDLGGDNLKGSTMPMQ